MKIKASSCFLMVILATALAVLIWTFTVESMKFKLMPLIFSLCVLVLGLIQLSQEFLESRVAHTGKEIESKESSGEKENKKDKIDKMKYLIALGWVAGLILLIFLIGFIPATMIFVFSYMKTYERGWVKSIAFTAVFSGIFWILFDLALEIDFPPGIFFGGAF